MTAISTWTFTADELSGNVNRVKDMLAEQLCTAGVIDEEQSRAIQEDYALLVLQKGVLGSVIDGSLFGNDKEKTIFKMIQVNNIRYNKKENLDVHQPTDSHK